jgi:hypothetical protein
MLFGHLTSPEPGLTTYLVDSKVRFEIRLRGHDYHLGEAWTDIVKPHLDELAAELAGLAEQHLRTARHILVAAGDANDDWDPLSHRRSAIEPHAQDNHSEPPLLLVDIARDSLEELLRTGHRLGPALIDSWAGSDVPLLRRLALHGWVVRTDVDDDTKITWLCDQGWLFDAQLHHEIYQLIAAAVPGATQPVADRLVALSAQGPPP